MTGKDERKTKKAKVDSSEPIVIRDNSTLSRLNYHFTMARELSLQAVRIREDKNDAHKQVLLHIKLARNQVKTARDIAAKMTCPMTKDVKRLFCKKCSTFLLAGLTCIHLYHVEANKLAFMTRVCYGCGNRKRWLVPPPLAVAADLAYDMSEFGLESSISSANER